MGVKKADPPRDRHARKRRSIDTESITPSGMVLDRLRMQLGAAVRRENQAVGRVREMRRRTAEIVARAGAAGVPYDVIARAALWARLGRAPTIGERLREADRLRKRRSRHRVTDSHAGQPAPGIGSPPSGVPCSSEVMNMGQKLVKKTTTIEEFVEDGGLHGVTVDEDLDDALEGEDEDDDADDAATEKAPPTSRRPRR